MFQADLLAGWVLVLSLGLLVAAMLLITKSPWKELRLPKAVIVSPKILPKLSKVRADSSEEFGLAGS